MRLLTVMMALLASGCGAPYELEITAAEYGERWPLKQEKATLTCIDKARFIVVDGMAYGLNGPALRAGLPRPDAILNDRQNALALIGDLSAKAESLCEK